MFFKNIIAKFTVFLAAILSILNVNNSLIPKNTGAFACTNVFVHGLMGWGEHDPQYKLAPHWGMMGGDLMTRFRSEGYECYAASVAPTGSVWDRACELYAQLSGTRTDYGASHSAKYGHERFGKDFSNCPLMDKPWSTENKINLFGHSMGGATVRQLVSLLEKGSAEEQAATTDGSLSPLFAGGKADLVHAVVCLSAPHNGTSSYESKDFRDNDPKGLSGFMSGFLSSAMSKRNSDSPLVPDTANFDLTIDGATLLNKSIVTAENVYYFSVATDCTHEQPDGTFAPDNSVTEMMFREGAKAMGRAMFTTKGGTVVDKAWLPNDGLVNVISARYPFNEPNTEYNFGDGVPNKGVWNVLPDVLGDHMYFIGDLMKPVDPADYYFSLFEVLDSLPY